MVGLLPPELLHLIAQKCPCRESQIRQLATYYNGSFPSPPALVAYGLETSSKIDVIVNVLEKRGISHAVIKSWECLSQRHLLSKIFAVCVVAFGQETQVERFDKTDSINALLGNLRKLFEGGEKFVVVIQDIDRLKQSTPTLLPAIARLGEMVPGFSIIMTSNCPRPLNLHKSGIPYVHFPPYTRAEAVSIITSRKPPLLPESFSDTIPAIEEKSLTKLYAQFAITVYDSLISSTSSTSLQVFQSTCDKLWPEFIEPMILGQEPPGKGGAKSWDFAKLLVQNRNLFQSKGESALHVSFTTQSPRKSASLLDSTVEAAMSSAPSTPSRNNSTISTPTSSRPMNPEVFQPKSTTRPPLLKQFPTLVLLSSYLASHTFPKHDILLFSRMGSTSSATSKKIRRLRQTPTKRKMASTPSGTPKANPETPTKSRTKSIFSAKANLGIPRPFTLERLVAILRAVHPHGIPNRPNRGVSDRVYRELGELERLRLVVRASGSASSGVSRGASTSGGGGDDAGEEKWRINVSRDWVVSMGHVWGMGVGEYEVEQDI